MSIYHDNDFHLLLYSCIIYIHTPQQKHVSKHPTTANEKIDMQLKIYKNRPN